MKLVKSLLLSSAVGITAVASAQAADLPFRKAAPVEYVRVCDYTGAGYFYIPGTDTCLKVGGYLRAEYHFIEPTKAFFPTPVPFAASLFGFSGPALGVPGVVNGAFVTGRNRDASGFKTEGRVDVDARTQTAYGTLRTYVRMQFDRLGGNQATGGVAGGAFSYANGAGNLAYLDKGFIQFAGFTAGRVQSFFDFYADNYNFEGIANSDLSTTAFAYTATFGGGFSATVAVEDAQPRRDGIGQSTVDLLAGNFAETAVRYDGQRIPDIIGNIRLDQAWGSAQLSGAYHQISTNGTTDLLGLGAFVTQSHRSEDGFAVQAGVQIKLPMLAAGDDIWLEGAYQNGAYLYMDSASNLNNGFGSLFLGGFQHLDADLYAYGNADGTYSVAKSEGFSVMGAFHHYFTPNFSDVLFGSYESVGYGRRARNTDWTFGGIGDASEYRIGNQFIWTPVNNLSVGLEIIYAHIDQTLAHSPGVAATPLPFGVKKDPSAFEGTLRVERDF
jgi:hypothetical protein